MELTEQDMSAYYATILWTGTDETTESGGYPLDDNYTEDDIDQASKDESLKYCQDFINLVESQPSPDPDYNNLLELALEFAGSSGGDNHAMGTMLHDFYLTRCGHGAGYWDGDYRSSDRSIDIGDKLTELAKTYGNVDAYVGDDGKIYLTE